MQRKRYTAEMEAPLVERQRLVRVARGLEAADVVVKNARVVDVLTKTIYRANVAICGGFIAAIGEYLDAAIIIDAKGKFLSPGLVDAHIHLESAMMTPRRFAEVCVPRGTVGVVAEPHELVNVMGIKGLTYMLDAGKESALRVWASVPSCVPASQFENPASSVLAGEVKLALKMDGVLGLAEMMNYPGVLNEDKDVWSILEAARGRRRDGHAAGLNGRDLTAYVAAGIHSDHEATNELEAFERLRAGLWLMVREGSAARNLEAIAPLLIRSQPHRAMLVSDDVDARELIELGHMDRLLREAVKNGIDPVQAIRLCSLAPAEYWKLEQRGAVAPGYAADLVLFDDLSDFKVEWTMIAGEIVARDGQLLNADEAAEHPNPAVFENTIKLPEHWDISRLAVEDNHILPVIQVHKDQIFTGHLEPELLKTADPDRDLVKLAVIERHHGSGRTGVAFAKGIGLRRGAMAQSILHDAHNIIVAGVDDNDMVTAVRELERIGGGAVIVEDGEVAARVCLPIAGLICDEPPNELLKAQREFETIARVLGCTLPHPIITLAFLGLTVIPSLKLTDRGLFDVNAFKLVEPETEDTTKKTREELEMF
jgi:adenine deaminase